LTLPAAAPTVSALLAPEREPPDDELTEEQNQEQNQERVPMLRKSLSIPAVALIAVLTLTATAPAVARAETGIELFARAGCIYCHGENGDGRGPVAAAILKPKPRDFTAAEFKFDADHNGSTGSNADLLQVIRRGALAFGGSAIMMPNPALSEDEIKTLIAFLRRFEQ
jgi:cytochrome c551/c552